MLEKIFLLADQILANGARSDFGVSVAISGNYAIMGAYTDDDMVIVVVVLIFLILLLEHNYIN